MKLTLSVEVPVSKLTTFHLGSSRAFIPVPSRLAQLPSFLTSLRAKPFESKFLTRNTSDGSHPSMDRHATTCSKVSALWRGRLLTRRACNSRLAVPRPQISSTRNCLAGSIKYNPNMVSFRPFTELHLFPAHRRNSIRSHMTSTEFVGSFYGLACR